MKSRIVLLGPPAAGKGTQAELIRGMYGLPIVSPGAILRDEAKAGTKLGREADSLTREGRLVPDAMVLQVVSDWLDGHGDQFVLDGFPRTLGQARALDKLLEQKQMALDAAIALEARLETLQGRVANRVVCNQCGKSFSLNLHVESLDSGCPTCGGQLSRRQDDSVEALAFRMEEYREKTAPVSDYYDERGVLFRVEADATADTVFAKIETILAES